MIYHWQKYCRWPTVSGTIQCISKYRGNWVIIQFLLYGVRVWGHALSKQQKSTSMRLTDEYMNTSHTERYLSHVSGCNFKRVIAVHIFSPEYQAIFRMRSKSGRTELQLCALTGKWNPEQRGRWTATLIFMFNDELRVITGRLVNTWLIFFRAIH